MWTFWKKIVSWQKLRQCLPFHLGRSFPRISRIIPADNGSCREWAFADHNTNCLGGTFAACALHLVTIARITTVTWSDPKLTCTGDCTDPVCCALLWRINLWQSIINEFPKGAWHGLPHFVPCDIETESVSHDFPFRSICCCSSRTRTQRRCFISRFFLIYRKPPRKRCGPLARLWVEEALYAWCCLHN